MRLRRLDLTRYGKFTGQTLDFGASNAGTPDLHIVYGLNEAGKSTTFSAFLDLLYGIPERSPYNFLHPYNTMQIGARLEFDGGEHELLRLKQRTGSLVDGGGQPLNEAMLASALGGIGRDAYRTMFSLDDQSLKEGGNSILQSRGELGELLFSASSGLAGLSKALAAAAEEASEIFRKRSSTSELAKLKQILASLKTERESVDTLAAAYAGLMANHQTASRAYEEAMADFATLRAGHAEISRRLSALPLASELRRLLDENLAQGELPRPPSEWFALLPDLSRDETRLQVLSETTRRTVGELTEAIEAIDIDDPILVLGSRISGLEEYRARFRTAEADLPKRRIALAAQSALLASILADLDQKGHAEPQSLLLPVSIIGELRDLIETRSGVEAGLQAAEREAERAEQALARLQDDDNGSPQDTGIAPDALRRIDMAHAQLRNSDLQARLSVAQRSAAQLRREADTLLAALGPWAGDIEALRRTPAAEPRQIEAWRGMASALERRIDDCRNRLRDLVTEERQAQARIGGLHAAGPVDDQEAIRLRRERDDAWREHAAQLDHRSAELFHERLQSDDALSAQRLARAHELAEIRQLHLTLAETRAAILRQNEMLAEAEAESETLTGRLRTLLPSDGVDQGSPSELVAGLESWTERRNRVLATSDMLAKSQAEVDDLSRELQTLAAGLADALAAAGQAATDADSIGNLLENSAALLQREREKLSARQAHVKRVESLERDAAERRQALEAATVARESWQSRWTATLAKTWFPEPTHSPSAVRAMLDALSGLPAALREFEQLTQRIETMERDREQFRAEVAELCHALGQTFGAQQDPLAASETLQDRLDAARHALQTRADRQAELDKQLATLKSIDQDMALHDARKAELTGFFGADSLAAVSLQLEQVSERQRRDGRISQLQSQIADILGVAGFAAAADLLDDIDAPRLEGEAAELSARMEILGERTRLLFSDMTRAKDRLDAVGGDDAVARIEARRRTVLLEMEELAIRYLTLRAGTLAAEQALHLYREKHRSSMMNRASEAFRLITGGNYSGLTTRPDKDREILIGVARDGSSKLAETMSTGTQFQLYLALRLAGYEEFASVRSPVPFVADDIMESFDDPRSEEVFRLLGEMARVGQVIYLTHHRHLCEIARRTVPCVQIHTLG